MSVQSFSPNVHGVHNPANRIQILDILRGMALMGILIVHFVTGPHWMFADNEQRALMPLPVLNQVLSTIVDFFFTDKSRTLFAFMFGISFFIQLKTAEHHLKPFKQAFLWRLTILMVLGLLHAHFLFGGDILRYYAAGGLLLLLVYKWSSAALLVTGLFLTIGIPLITSIVTMVYEINLFAGFPPMSTVHEGYMSPSFWDNLKINHLTATWRYNAFFLLYFAVPATGIFLFGIWMGRRNYFQHPEKHIKELKRFVAWGLGLGFLIQAGNLLVNIGLENKVISGSPILLLVKDLMLSFSVLLVALGYVCTLTLLCLRPGWNCFLSILAPAGRMTLTNYVMQSVLLWWFFNGSGLVFYLKIGPSVTILVALVFCAIQLACSYYWLQYFKMGPLEWVWRYANQGKKPLFRNQ